ncbi:MAG: hypothetical protein HY922_13720 [Elusimicrobia bacterium]|nr:hypothetical protein [Elusimicrobiota bacterium]
MKNKPFLFAAAALSAAVWLLASPQKAPSARVHGKIVVTNESLSAFIEGQDAMKDLPEDARIGLKFYASGPEGRRWDESYSIGKHVREEEAQRMSISSKNRLTKETAKSRQASRFIINPPAPPSPPRGPGFGDYFRIDATGAPSGSKRPSARRRRSSRRIGTQ